MELSHVQTPALILDLDVFEENARIMQDYVSGTKMALRPHYKSHKCTAIAHRQIAAGAKGICCAKVSEAEDLANAGIEDILIANQVADPAKITRVATLAAGCYVTVAVDNAQNIADLETAAAFQQATIHCLVEYEIGMNRCGVQTPEAVYALVQEIDRHPHLVFEGIQAYAGNLSHETDEATRKRESEKVEERLRELLDFLDDKGVPVKEVSGVSTGTIGFRPQDTVYTEVQPGSYLFMDAAYNQLHLPFKNALFVLARVISVNEQQVVCDAGMKTVSVDQDPPVLKGYPHAALRMSEEHITVSAADCAAGMGDLLFVIPSHCCTTVNLHDHLILYRGNKVVDKVPVTSRGKSL